MLKTRLLIASAGKETGDLLREYLEARGVVIDQRATPVVCYGVPNREKLALNGNCGLDKVERLVKMQAAGVNTVPWFNKNNVPPTLKFPILARKSTGYGGTDIVPIFQRDEIAWRIAAGWDWFSQYVPVEKEYRAWVFRGQPLGLYTKVMARPQEYKYIGRNFRNGFEFQKVEDRKDVFELASKALDAVKFDFGAVDMLEGRDGKLYILELNTAPGVIRSRAQGTLAALADHITVWLQEGSPKCSRW